MNLRHDALAAAAEWIGAVELMRTDTPTWWRRLAQLKSTHARGMSLPERLD